MNDEVRGPLEMVADALSDDPDFRAYHCKRCDKRIGVLGEARVVVCHCELPKVVMERSK